MNDWNKEDFGIRLKKLREERGLSMMAFGTAIGTSASRIKDWEKGKNAPSAAWVAKISDRFNVSTDELILGNAKTAKPFKNSGSTNVDTLYDKLRENVISDIETKEQELASHTDELYAELDAIHKENYRSGKGRRRAELEMLAILTELPKKEVLELLELAKLKKTLVVMTTTVNTMKKKAPLRRKWFLFLLIIGLLSFFIYKGNTTVGVTRYEIMSDKIPVNYDKYRIVQISDLHDAEFGENHLDVVDKVKMITPQAIFITGDFIDSNRYNLEQSLILIEELQFVAPIYYVTGNHEVATQDMDRIQVALENLGVRVLSDEADVITMFPDSSIAIGGIEDPLASEFEDDEAVKKSIERAFENIPDEMFKILLSHRPEQFDEYAEAGIDVTFSGHAHGGQFRIPGIGGLVSPGQGMFPKYFSGVHENNGSHLVVSRGLGNSIIPVRLFNQPEIVVVTLRKSE